MQIMKRQNLRMQQLKQTLASIQWMQPECHLPHPFDCQVLSSQLKGDWQWQYRRCGSWRGLEILQVPSTHSSGEVLGFQSSSPNHQFKVNWQYIYYIYIYEIHWNTPCRTNAYQSAQVCPSWLIEMHVISTRSFRVCVSDSGLNLVIRHCPWKTDCYQFPSTKNPSTRPQLPEKTQPFTWLYEASP